MKATRKHTNSSLAHSNADELATRNVTMSNALTRAGQGLTLAEKRLIAACIAQNDSFSMAHASGALPCISKLTATAYAKLYDVNTTTAYEQLKSASLTLHTRVIRIEKETHTGWQVYECNWIGARQYHDGEGWIELHWWHAIVPHLYGLRDQFTTYKLKHAAALRSMYAWRLFELLKSWEKKGSYEPTIEEFHRAMDASATMRANFKDLRRRCIEPAVAELINKNGLLLTWQPIKAGRKVTGLKFAFEANPQKTMF